MNKRLIALTFVGALAGFRFWLNSDHPAVVVGRQHAFRLVQQNQFIAEGVANPSAPPNRDVERTLHGLTARG